MYSTQFIDQLPTFVAEPVCPICRQPIQRLREDPRGVEIPFCCGVYWIPRWKFLNGHLQFHLTYYAPILPGDGNIIHENEIPFETTAPESNDNSDDNSDDTSEQTALPPAARIEAFLIAVNTEHTARTAEIRHACELSASSFKWGMDQLFNEAKVEKIGHGIWRLMPSSSQNSEQNSAEASHTGMPKQVGQDVSDDFRDEE